MLWLLLIALVVLVTYRGADPRRAGAAAWRVAGLLMAAGLTATTLWQLNWLSPAWQPQPGGVLAGVGTVAVLAGTAFDR